MAFAAFAWPIATGRLARLSYDCPPELYDVRQVRNEWRSFTNRSARPLHTADPTSAARAASNPAESREHA